MMSDSLHTTQPIVRKPLVDDCDNCGKPGGLKLPEGPDAPGHHYCPDCLPAITMARAAEAQLRNLLSPILGAWKATWSQHLPAETLAEIQQDSLNHLNPS